MMNMGTVEEILDSTCMKSCYAKQESNLIANNYDVLKKGKMNRLVQRYLAVILWISACCLPAEATVYSITDLGDLGGNYSQGRYVNNAGQVVGTSYLSGSPHQEHAFIWQSGSMTDLGTLGGYFSVYPYINSSGVIAFDPDLSSGTRHPGIWSGGTIADLMASYPGDVGQVSGINDAGTVIGRSWHGTAHPFEYVGGIMVDLSSYGMYTSASLSGINNSGQICGSNTSSTTFAFIYSGGIQYPLGAIGTGTVSQANGINDLGQVVGSATTDSTNTYRHAFVWYPTTPNGTTGNFHELLPLAGTLSLAQGINTYGEVVGATSVSGGGNHAFIWHRRYSDTGMEDLNTLIPSGSGVTLDIANGINDKGWIAATGTLPSGYSHGFLLIPL